MQRGDDAGSHKSRRTTHQPSPLSDADESRLGISNTQTWRHLGLQKQHINIQRNESSVCALPLSIDENIFQHAVVVPSVAAHKLHRTSDISLTVSASSNSNPPGNPKTVHQRSIGPLNNTVRQQRSAVGVWAERERNYLW